MSFGVRINIVCINFSCLSISCMAVALYFALTCCT